MDGFPRVPDVSADMKHGSDESAGSNSRGKDGEIQQGTVSANEEENTFPHKDIEGGKDDGSGNSNAQSPVSDSGIGSRDPAKQADGTNRKRSNSIWQKIIGDDEEVNDYERPNKQKKSNSRSKGDKGNSGAEVGAYQSSSEDENGADQGKDADGRTSKTKESKQNKRLRRDFGLPKTEILIESFSCALLKNILIQGKLYIFPRYVCFASKLLKAHVVLPLSDVTDIQKKNTVKVIPNAIELTTKGGHRYFLSSFLFREDAFNCIYHFWRIAEGVASALQDEDLAVSSEASGSQSEASDVSEAMGGDDVIEALENEAESQEIEDNRVNKEGPIETANLQEEDVQKPAPQAAEQPEDSAEKTKDKSTDKENGSGKLVASEAGENASNTIPAKALKTKRSSKSRTDKEVPKMKEAEKAPKAPKMPSPKNTSASTRKDELVSRNPTSRVAVLLKAAILQTHTIEESKLPDKKHVILEGFHMPCTVAQWFKLFVADDNTFMTYYHGQRGDYNVKCSKWVPIDDICDDGDAQNGLKCTVQWNVQFKSPLSAFGHKMEVFNQQTKQLFINNTCTHLVIIETTKSNAPFGDIFKIVTRYDLQQAGGLVAGSNNVGSVEQPGIIFAVSCQVPFSKSSMLKGKVISEAVSTLRSSFKLMSSLMLSEVEAKNSAGLLRSGSPSPLQLAAEGTAPDSECDGVKGKLPKQSENQARPKSPFTTSSEGAPQTAVSSIAPVQSLPSNSHDNRLPTQPMAQHCAAPNSSNSSPSLYFVAAGAFVIGVIFGIELMRAFRGPSDASILALASAIRMPQEGVCSPAASPDASTSTAAVANALEILAKQLKNGGLDQ